MGILEELAISDELCMELEDSLKKDEVIFLLNSLPYDHHFNAVKVVSGRRVIVSLNEYEKVNVDGFEKDFPLYRKI